MRMDCLTDRIHWVRSELKHAIEDKCATLEEDIAPVPSVVFDDMVCLCLHPNVKGDEYETTQPSVRVIS